MGWKKRIVSLIACGWIGFVILACTDEESMVSGDRFSGGGCPPGETCAPTEGSAPYFLAAQTPGAAMTSGELPPVATGASTWVRLVQQFPSDDRWDDGVRTVPDAVFVVDGLDVEGGFGTARLSGTTPGSYMVRAENEAGGLYDRISIRVVDAASVIARPVFGYPGLASGTLELGPETGWRVWPAATVHYVERAQSASGERLVSLDSAEDDSHHDLIEAPSVGPLEVALQAGDLTATTTFPLATAADSFVRFLPECDSLFAESMCLFGEQGDQPIIGAPITITDGGDPFELDTTSPCISLDEEAREITFTIVDRTWTTIVPPLGCDG